MPYVFQAVDIFAFDLHVTVNPLADPHLVQENFGYLVNPAEYRAKYESGAAIESGNFIVRPLTWREHHKRNHFWKAYLGMWPGGKVDYWGLQVPFSLQPNDSRVKFITEGKDFRVEVRPRIYLYSFGWSTNLNIYVRGKITPGQLQELISNIRSVNKAVTPFTIGSEQKNLSGVFQYFSEQVRNEVYVPTDALGDGNPVSRYLVTSLAQYAGPLEVYRRDAGAERMPDSDRAMLYSTLEGRSISIDDLEKIEQGSSDPKQRKYLVTRHSPPDFFEPDITLTRFDYGTLLFIQKTARGDGKDLKSMRRDRRRVRCLASNIRLYLLMNMALLSFSREATASFGDDASPDYGSTAINKRLQHNSKAILQRLHTRYKNSFSRSFYGHYKPLQDLSEETHSFQVS